LLIYFWFIGCFVVEKVWKLNTKRNEFFKAS